MIVKYLEVVYPTLLYNPLSGHVGKMIVINDCPFILKPFCSVCNINSLYTDIDEFPGSSHNLLCASALIIRPFFLPKIKQHTIEVTNFSCRKLPGN